MPIIPMNMVTVTQAYIEINEQLIAVGFPIHICDESIESVRETLRHHAEKWGLSKINVLFVTKQLGKN